MDRQLTAAESEMAAFSVPQALADNVALEERVEQMKMEMGRQKGESLQQQKELQEMLAQHKGQVARHTSRFVAKAAELMVATRLIHGIQEDTALRGELSECVRMRRLGRGSLERLSVFAQPASSLQSLRSQPRLSVFALPRLSVAARPERDERTQQPRLLSLRCGASLSAGRRRRRRLQAVSG